MSIRDRTANLPISATALLAGAGAAGTVFLAVCLFAFTRPTSKPAPQTVAYTQQMSFGYRAAVRPGPVYPDGVVATGDPIFTQLVHRVAFHAAYHLTTAAAHQLTGTEQVGLELVGPSGWSKTVPLGPPTRLKGDAADAKVVVDLDQVQGLMNQFGRLIGAQATGLFTAALVANVQARGQVAGKRVLSSFSPTLSLNFNGVQLQLGGSASNASGTLAECLEPEQGLPYRAAR